jgi:TPR repeat protein
MTPISQLVAVSVFAVLVAASSPVALSQAAQRSSDEQQAFLSALEKAEKGNASAQFNLALLYYIGEGVPKNDVEAVKWYRHAADQGYSRAQNDLGFMYAYGVGVPKNDAEAVKWYRRAADQGNADAQDKLGFHYYMGIGVPASYFNAYFWWNLAAAQGNELAQKNRDTVAGIMTREQIAEAQRRSAAWKPKKE